MRTIFDAGDHLLALAPTIIFRRVRPPDGVNEALRLVVKTRVDPKNVYVRDFLDVGRPESRYLGRHVHERRTYWEQLSADVPDNGVLALEDDAIVTLKDWIGSAIAEVGAADPAVGTMILGSWAQIYRSGDFIEPHTHAAPRTTSPNSFWSGAYYIDDGQPDAAVTYSGVISFSAAGSLYHFRPEPGLLLLWPSHIQHYVNPFVGSGERIMISWNMGLSQAEKIALMQRYAAPQDDAPAVLRQSRDAPTPQ